MAVLTSLWMLKFVIALSSCSIPISGSNTNCPTISCDSCGMTPSERAVQGFHESLLKEKASIYVRFKNDSQSLFMDKEMSVYGNQWVWALEGKGYALLTYPYDFRYLSLGTLGPGVDGVDIPDNPLQDQCFVRLSDGDREVILACFITKLAESAICQLNRNKSSSYWNNAQRVFYEKWSNSTTRHFSLLYDQANEYRCWNEGNISVDEAVCIEMGENDGWTWTVMALAILLSLFSPLIIVSLPQNNPPKKYTDKEYFGAKTDLPVGWRYLICHYKNSHSVTAFRAWLLLSIFAIVSSLHFVIPLSLYREDFHIHMHKVSLPFPYITIVWISLIIPTYISLLILIISCARCESIRIKVKSTLTLLSKLDSKNVSSIFPVSLFTRATCDTESLIPWNTSEQRLLSTQETDSMNTLSTNPLDEEEYPPKKESDMKNMPPTRKILDVENENIEGGSLIQERYVGHSKKGESLSHSAVVIQSTEEIDAMGIPSTSETENVMQSGHSSEDTTVAHYKQVEKDAKSIPSMNTINEETNSSLETLGEILCYDLNLRLKPATYWEEFKASKQCTERSEVYLRVCFFLQYCVLPLLPLCRVWEISFNLIVILIGPCHKLIEIMLLIVSLVFPLITFLGVFLSLCYIAELILYTYTGVLINFDVYGKYVTAVGSAGVVISYFSIHKKYCRLLRMLMKQAQEFQAQVNPLTTKLPADIAKSSNEVDMASEYGSTNNKNINSQIESDEKENVSVEEGRFITTFGDIPYIEKDLYDACVDKLLPIGAELFRFVLMVSISLIVISFALHVSKSVEDNVELPAVISEILIPITAGGLIPFLISMGTSSEEALLQEEGMLQEIDIILEDYQKSFQIDEASAGKETS